jgi:tripartite ATP-independent transporter DctM subunit
MLICMVGVVVFWNGEAGLYQFTINIFESLTTFALLPIALFVMLGEVMFHSGIAFRAIDIIEKWMGRLPGRLSLITIGASTLFAATSGSSIGTAAMLGSVMLPEMEKRGYKKEMSIGPIMAGGGLASIIPPSGLAVLLASVAQISVGRLLIAGVIPGLIMASFFTLYVIIRCWLQPSIAPSYPVPPTPLLIKIMATVEDALPISFIIFLVLGLIFLGVATPSEAAAVGVVGSLVLAACYGKIKWGWLKISIVATMRTTVMVLMIVSAAKTFSQILAFSGVTLAVAKLALAFALPKIGLIIAMMFILVVMGCFMESFSIMLVTIPIFMPIVQAIGYNPLVFCLLMLVNLEMGMITPPFGLLLFTMKAVAPRDTTMGDIYKAGLPFIACHFVAMALVMVFPVLALWLPDIMR